MNIGQTLILKIIEAREPNILIGLEATDFQEDFERPMFTFVQDYYSKYSTLPPINIVRNRFKLEAIETEGDVRFWVDELHKRKFMLTYDEGVNRINPFVASGSLEQARQELLELNLRLTQVGKIVAQPQPLEELFRSAVERLRERRTKDGIVGIPCGWPALSRMLRGWIPGNVYIVAGRKKLGKSEIMAISSYAAAVTGNYPLMVSMEMTTEEYTDRILSIHTKIGLNYIASGRLSTPLENALRESLTTPLPFKYEFQEGFFRSSIADIDLMVMMYKPKILFIDGAYLIKPPTGTNKMAGWEKITEIIKELKLVAGRHHIPIVCSYQFNKEGEVHLSDSICQIATGVMGVYMPKDRSDQRIIKVIDNRNGPRGELTINWDFDSVNFDELLSTDEGQLSQFFGEGE